MIQAVGTVQPIRQAQDVALMNAIRGVVTITQARQLVVATSAIRPVKSITLVIAATRIRRVIRVSQIHVNTVAHTILYRGAFNLQHGVCNCCASYWFSPLRTEIY